MSQAHTRANTAAVRDYLGRVTESLDELVTDTAGYESLLDWNTAARTPAETPDTLRRTAEKLARGAASKRPARPSPPALPFPPARR